MYMLNLPAFETKISKSEKGVSIFDSLRRKYIMLTPEEWVRQHFVNFLVNYKKYPASLIVNEMKITLNSMTRRCDSVVYDNKMQPLAICEYKSPNVVINQNVFDQIVRYNIVLKVKYLMVSNGMQHYCCEMNFENQTYRFLDDIPEYSLLVNSEK